MAPSQEYRTYLRQIRLFLDPETEALLMGDKINDLTMDDLEALYQLVMHTNPPVPSNYVSRRCQGYGNY